MENNNILDNYIDYRLNLEKEIDKDQVKRIFIIACKELQNNINPVDLVVYQSEILEYVIGEIKGNLTKDENQLAKNAIESFNLNYTTEESTISQYSVYLTKFSNLVSFLKKINKNTVYFNPEVSLINDLFESVFNHLKAFTTLISSNLFSSALASWRSLHESECVLKVLLQNTKIRKVYVEHIKYDNYLRNPNEYTKEELDENFAILKKEMAKHDLKSKVMKKFIEYGYLYYSSNYDPKDTNFKLNFRDGLEALAGLSKYSNVYDGASQVVHSSSSYFYINEDFCRILSISLTYHSTIRITNLYLDYMKNYFDKNPDDLKYIKYLLNELIKISHILDKENKIDSFL